MKLMTAFELQEFLLLPGFGLRSVRHASRPIDNSEGHSLCNANVKNKFGCRHDTMMTGRKLYSGVEAPRV